MEGLKNQELGNIEHHAKSQKTTFEGATQPTASA
jgi:hypothetical protein